MEASQWVHYLNVTPCISYELLMNISLRYCITSLLHWISQNLQENCWLTKHVWRREDVLFSQVYWADWTTMKFIFSLKTVQIKDFLYAYLTWIRENKTIVKTPYLNRSCSDRLFWNEMEIKSGMGRKNARMLIKMFFLSYVQLNPSLNWFSHSRNSSSRDECHNFEVMAWTL